ncbi:MAG: SpoIID/LytB domain-containing protein [Bacteroidota bacterium]
MKLKSINIRLTFIIKDLRVSKLVGIFCLLLMTGWINPTAALSLDRINDDRLELSTTDSISVLLFSNLSPRSLKISPLDGPITVDLDNQTWTIEDSTTVIQVRRSGSVISVRRGQRTYRTSQLKVHNSEVSLIRIIEAQAGYRYYRGTIRIQPKGNTLGVINRVWLEDYIGSVVGSEMNFEHHEALKVQAVIARTYALWNLETASFDGFDVTDHTMSQVYLGELTGKPRYRDAALATTGEFLTWSNKLILASFFSTCGGRTVDNESVWKGEPLPYLRATVDQNACQNSPHFRWSFSILKNELHQIIQEQTGWTVTKVGLGQADRFENVSQLAVYTESRSDDPHRMIPANKFRLWVMKAVGPRSLKSTRFQFTQPTCNMHYHFEGKGLGHGVGLCQWGALGLAQSGWSYDEILRFYYQGVEIADIYEWPSNTIDLAR